MKKSLILILMICFTGYIMAQEATAKRKVKWYTFEEAVQLQIKEPRVIMVDLYTDWCGWCKRMDATTFENDTVATYLNQFFYPVKFNAESKEDIHHAGQVLKFRAEAGRGGVHELAVALTDGKLGYPCFIYLNEKMERIMISPGYKGPKDVLNELEFTSGAVYQTTSWDDFKKSKGSKP